MPTFKYFVYLELGETRSWRIIWIKIKPKIQTNAPRQPAARMINNDKIANGKCTKRPLFKTL